MHHLAHPHLCSVLHITDHPTFGPFLVMHFIDGVELGQYRVRILEQTKSPPTVGLLATIARQSAEALDYMHAEGILHLDIKQQNILVMEKGTTQPKVKVVDFGIAATISTTMNTISKRTYDKGSVPYMPPEAFTSADDRPTRRSDLYSLGVALYEFQSGQLPFTGRDVNQIIYKITNSDVAVPPIAGVPDHVNCALLRALSRNPEARFTSCGAFAAALAGETAKPQVTTNQDGAVAGRDTVRVTPSAASPPKDPWIGSRAGEIRKINFRGLEVAFCWCPPGEFEMGSPAVEAGRSDNENEVAVRITHGFWMAQAPVTQGLFQKISGGIPKDQNQTGDQYPVTQVDGPTCDNFARQFTKLLRKENLLPEGWWVGLPTEAQWEYACRAGTDTPWFCGPNEAVLKDYAWYTANSGGTLQAVGTRKPNPWNLHDMAGLVWEWCADHYDATLKGGDDPTGPEVGSFRVSRGGGWANAAGGCRSAGRDRLSPEDWNYDLGFRLLLVR